MLENADFGGLMGNITDTNMRPNGAIMCHYGANIVHSEANFVLNDAIFVPTKQQKGEFEYLISKYETNSNTKDRNPKLFYAHKPYLIVSLLLFVL